MKTTQRLLLTTMLSASLVITALSAYAADSITTKTVETAAAPISNAAINDPRIAAIGFVEHVNYARVALAMNNTDLAKQHITQARNMEAVIKATSIEQRRITQLQSGRVVYQYETDYKYHYFPLQTGPVPVQKMNNGPIWAENSLAVTDADIVYLTLDLSGDKADMYFTAANNAMIAGNLKEADNQLAMLTDAVVMVDKTVAVPADKARDNIALARNFIAGKNYDGARFALKHADTALDEMQKNDNYKVRRPNIVAMRKDVADMQTYITKKDPSMISKTDAKLNTWWNEMKTWSTTTTTTETGNQ